MAGALDTPSDASLIARVLGQSDQHAFRQLVLRYQSPLRRWTRRLCNGNLAAAEDLAQEVFLKAYQSLGSYRGEARFSTWLYRIAFNLAASQKRRARERYSHVEWSELNAKRQNESQDTHTAIGIEPSHTPTADARRDIDKALARLGEAQHWALRLSLEEGMSHEEIAVIMSIPLGTVKTHLLRGKEQLRKQLAGWQETVQ